MLASSTTTLCELLVLLLLILSCLFVLLCILATWRDWNSRTVVISGFHATGIAFCDDQYPYPGPEFTAMRFEAGIAQREWPNDNNDDLASLSSADEHLALVHQPMDVIFHENFRPQPDCAIAVHFKGDNEVTVTSVPLAKRLQIGPTAPGRVYIDYGPLDLLPSEFLADKEEEGEYYEVEGEEEDHEEEEEEEEEEGDEAAAQERTGLLSKWRHPLITSLTRHKSWYTSLIPILACLSAVGLAILWTLILGSIHCPPLLSLASLRLNWTRASSATTHRKLELRLQTAHPDRSLDATAHIQNIITSWVDVPKLLLGIADSSSTATYITQESEREVFQDADYIITDVCQAVRLLSFEDNTNSIDLLDLEVLCSQAHHHTTEAAIFWTRIHASYTKQVTKPLDTAARACRFIASEFRELSKTAGDFLSDELDDGPNTEEQAQREERAQLAALRLNDAMAREGMVVRSARIWDYSTPDHEQDKEKWQSDKTMYHDWKFLIKWARLAGEEETGESSFLTSHCNNHHGQSNTSQAVLHPVCHLSTATINKKPDLADILKYTQLLLQSQTQRLPRESKSTKEQQIRALDRATWPRNFKDVASETLVLATLRHTWSAHLTALHLINLTEAKLQDLAHQNKEIPWSTWLSNHDTRDFGVQRKEAKTKHKAAATRHSIPSLEAFKELVHSRLEPISQRALAAGILISKIHRETGIVTSQIQDLLQFGGSGRHEWKFERTATSGEEESVINLELIQHTISPLQEQASILEQAAVLMDNSSQDVMNTIMSRRTTAMVTNPTELKQTAIGYVYWWHLRPQPSSYDPEDQQDDGENPGEDWTQNWGPPPWESMMESLDSLMRELGASSGQDLPLENYYELLGLSQTATEGEIKAAGRRVAQEFHPDKVKARTSGAALIDQSKINKDYIQLAHARSVLEDPQRKAQYDAGLAAGLTVAEFEKDKVNGILKEMLNNVFVLQE